MRDRRAFFVISPETRGALSSVYEGIVASIAAMVVMLIVSMGNFLSNAD